MTILTLQELRPVRFNLRSAHLSILQEQLNLYLKQVQIGLEPKISDSPQLEELIKQIRTVMPTVLQPNSSIQYGIDLTAPLTLPDSTTIYLQATVNLGTRHGVPKLFDWALRRPCFNWTDAIRLWVATEFYRRHGIAVNQLKLVVIALQPTRPLQAIVFDWSEVQQQQTEKWLVKRLQSSPDRPKPSKVATVNTIDFESLPEIAL